MARLEMAFLGGFPVELDGSAVNAFASNKARALLGTLAGKAEASGGTPRRWSGRDAIWREDHQFYLHAETCLEGP